MPPFELRGGVKATRVDALQARVPHLLNDARGDPIMRLALRSRRGHVQYVNGAVQRCGDTSISSGSIRISEGGNNNVTKNTYAGGFGQPLREAGRVRGLAGDAEMERTE